jgi:ABC-type phosphate transport system substrate-binding protein
LVLTRSAPLRLLPYEGVAPTAQALEDGRYPLQRPYHLVHRPDAPPEVLRFIDHLRSASSLRLARSLGYLALDR